MLQVSRIDLEGTYLIYHHDEGWQSCIYGYILIIDVLENSIHYQSKPDLAKCQTVHNLSLALFCWAIETFDLQKLYFRKSTLNDEQSPHSTQLNRSTHFTPLIHLTEKACFHFDILAHFKESRNILSSSKCNKWLIYSSLGVGFSWRRGLFGGGQNLGIYGLVASDKRFVRGKH